MTKLPIHNPNPLQSMRDQRLRRTQTVAAVAVFRKSNGRGKVLSRNFNAVKLRRID